jgi:putative aldouronate transport system permease protein
MSSALRRFPPIRRYGRSSYFRRHYDLYILLIPSLIFLAIFRYLPLMGNIIAFKELNLFAGRNIFDSIAKSPFVWLANFERAFRRPDFITAFRNTVVISVLKIVFLFPVPILLSILLNEVKKLRLKKTIQTMIYFPHFLSWVIVASLFLTFLNTDGVVNQIRGAFGLESIRYFLDKDHFRFVLVVSEGWKNSGWGTIVYLAAIATIDPELYEAAIIDGANKFQQIMRITLPGISSTIAMLFILRIGRILQVGFEQVFVMYNPTVYETGDVIQTFVYRVGLGQMDFSFASAMGLMNSAIGFVLILTANSVVRRTMHRSIW